MSSEWSTLLVTAGSGSTRREVVIAGCAVPEEVTS